MEILAVSGSLRAASINSAFCRAMVLLAPPGVNAIWFDRLGRIPPFNPDLESAPPAAVTDFRDAFTRADAVIIASPEYAHGVSGVLKNALDWLVSHEGVVGKPVAVINTSPRAHHACDSLTEILRTMSLDVVGDASVSISLLGYCVTEEAMLESADVRAATARMFDALVQACGK